MTVSRSNFATPDTEMPLRRGKKREVSRRGKGRGGEAREERRIEGKRRKKRREENTFTYVSRSWFIPVS